MELQKSTFTFREVYELELNCPRSTVQGWVNTFFKGRGYSDKSDWVFNQEEVNQLWRIRFWKDLGYKNDTIRYLLKKNICCEKKSLANTIQELERKKAELENLIRVANLMNETGLTPTGVRFDLIYPLELPYDVLMEFLSNQLDKSSFITETEFENLIAEDIWVDVYKCVENILAFFDKKKSYKSKQVQRLVHGIHSKLESVISKSVLVFYEILKGFFKDKEAISSFKEEYGDEKLKYLKCCFYWYCKENRLNDHDVKGIESIDRVQKLALQRYAINSAEVQREIDNLYCWVASIKLIKEEKRYEVLRILSDILGGDVCFQQLDGGKARGIAWFISQALQIYCDSAIINKR